MNEQTLTYLKILKYAPLSYLSDQEFEVSISGPGQARINFLQWIFNKILDDTSEFSSVKNNLNSKQDNYCDILKSAMSIGLCSNNDLDIIMGTNKTLRQWNFIDKIVECVMFLDDSNAAINLVNSKTISFLEHYDMDKEIERLMLPKESISPLLPPDIENFLSKYMNTNSPDYDLELKLFDLNTKILQKELDIKVKLNEYQAKTFKESENENLDIEDDKVAMSSNNLLNQLSITCSNFQNMFNQEFKDSVKVKQENCFLVSEAKKFIEDGKLVQLNPILKNFCEIEKHYGNICTQDNFDKVEQINSQLNKGLYNDFFTGEKVSITELIGSSSRALQLNNL